MRDQKFYYPIKFEFAWRKYIRRFYGLFRMKLRNFKEILSKMKILHWFKSKNCVLLASEFLFGLKWKRLHIRIKIMGIWPTKHVKASNISNSLRLAYICDVRRRLQKEGWNDLIMLCIETDMHERICRQKGEIQERSNRKKCANAKWKDLIRALSKWRVEKKVCQKRKK